MKTIGGDKALESYKFFPIIAWIVTISFAVFVYGISVELREITTSLKKQSDWIQSKIDEPTSTVDFEL